MRLRHRIGLMLVTVAALPALALHGLPEPAHADATLPRVHPQSDSPTDPWAKIDSNSVSAAKQRAVKRANKILQHAIDGKSLDYRKVKKYAKSAQWRRQFAAGWDWYPHRKIIHVSRAELRKIHAYSDGKPTWSELMDQTQGIRAQVEQCQGSNKIIKNYKGHRFDTWKFLDSCRTSALVFWYTVLAADLGVLAAMLFELPPAAITIAIFAAVVAVGAAIISYHQNLSTLNAVYLRNHNGWATVRGQ